MAKGAKADCIPCWQRQQNRGNKRTMMRVETEFYEFVDIQNRRHRADSIDEARAMRAEAGSGQVRRRVDFQDVLAVYAIRTGPVEHARVNRAAEAGLISKNDFPGSSIFMVPEGSPWPELVDA